MTDNVGDTIAMAKRRLRSKQRMQTVLGCSTAVTAETTVAMEQGFELWGSHEHIPAAEIDRHSSDLEIDRDDLQQALDVMGHFHCVVYSPATLASACRLGVIV